MEEYMNKKVNPILEQIVDSLLDNMPDDPILFMYKWLVNYKNSQTLKDASTRDSDIIICVESNCPETTEKIDDNENYENKKFKKENNDDNSSKVNIINLINLHNSLINKSSTNYKKISNVIDIGSNDSKLLSITLWTIEIILSSLIYISPKSCKYLVEY